MSAITIPDNIDPIRMAKQKRILTGNLALDKLPRLADLLVSKTGKVQMQVSAETSPQYPKGVLTCRVWGEIKVSCQRCLAPVSIDVDETVQVVPVKNVKAEQALSDSDTATPCLLDEQGQVSLWDLAEESLIVALPLIPRHAQPCKIQQAVCSSEVEDEDDETPSHFGNALLDALKN